MIFNEKFQADRITGNGTSSFNGQQAPPWETTSDKTVQLPHLPWI